MKIAVLVPAYNVEKYLEQCLDSILAQNCPGIEIYCCNDGSKDRTGEILRSYAQKYATVHAFQHENRGMVATYNRLLDEVPEDVEAIGFVDADDYVHPCMYEALATALKRFDADIAECGIARVSADSVQPFGVSAPAVNRAAKISDMSIYWLRRTATGRWINKNNKLYRSSAIRGIRFRRGLDFEDDFFFNCEVNSVAASKVVLPGDAYAYRENPASLNGSLDCRRYFNSVSERVRLSHEVFLNSRKVPLRFECEYRGDLARDAYRMMIRKNLKKNRNARERKELFFAASEYFKMLERDYGFTASGLNWIQRMIYRGCREKLYWLSRMLSYLA